MYQKLANYLILNYIFAKPCTKGLQVGSNFLLRSQFILHCKNVNLFRWLMLGRCSLTASISLVTSGTLEFFYSFVSFVSVSLTLISLKLICQIQHFSEKFKGLRPFLVIFTGVSDIYRSWIVSLMSYIFLSSQVIILSNVTDLTNLSKAGEQCGDY